MAEDGAFLFRIVKSFLLRVMICSKVMCCFPLDKIAVMSKQSRNSSAFSRFNKTNRNKRCKPARRNLLTKQIYEARTRDKSPNCSSIKTSKSSKMSVPRTDNTAKMEWVRFRKLKKGGKTKDMAMSTTDNVAANVIGDIYNFDQKGREISPIAKEKNAARRKPRNLINIFHATTKFSHSDFTKTDNASKDESSTFNTREYVQEMFDDFT